MTHLVFQTVHNIIFPVFGFGRSFANSLFWDTPWSDFAGLFELADDLQKTKFIWDEEERFACFSWTLCNHQRRDGEKKNNFLLILLRYVLIRSMHKIWYKLHLFHISIHFQSKSFHFSATTQNIKKNSVLD